VSQQDETPSYKNAIMLPLYGSENRPFYAGGATGGVFDAEHKPIEHAFLIRQYRQDAFLVGGKWDTSTGHEILTSRMNLPRDIAETKHHLAGTHIFAGYLFPHYGHFLLESLSRLWFIRQNPHLPLVWLGVHNQNEFNAMQRELFDLYRVQNPMYIVTEQTSVENLVVPHDGYIIHTRYSPEQIKALKLRDGCDTVPGKKVWLSRSKLDKGIVYNEREFERILEANGWTIYHPQEHSIREQVDMLADAEEIAGVEGSALHTLVLIPEYRGHVTIFGRGEKINFDYCLIAETAGISQRIVSPPRIEWSDGLRKWEANSFWTNFDSPLEELGILRQRNEWAEMPRSLENITKSVASFFKPSTFVELWPQGNSTTVHAKPVRSLAVGERFDFDLEPLRTAGITYMEVTADQYMTTRPVGAAVGLFSFRHQHDMNVLLRAFNASLTLSSPKTLWIIEGGSHANEQLLAYIFDYHPTLTLLRVRNSDIAIVWREPRHMHKAIHDAEDASKPDFRATLNAIPLNDIAKLITAQFKKIYQPS
jgi:hypothetical protein